LLSSLDTTPSLAAAAGATVPHLEMRSGTKRAAPAESKVSSFAAQVASQLNKQSNSLQQLFTAKDKNVARNSPAYA
jgi:hypothetical protein